MEHRAANYAQFHLAVAVVLFLPGVAYAQRVPEFVLWSAGASLFAPFVAVPIKLGVLRLMHLKAKTSCLWQISAIEWLLCFPIAFILLRSSRLSSAPLTVLALFGLVVWLHGVRLPNTRWRPALLLSLPTPILVFLLPFLALLATGYLESLAV